MASITKNRLTAPELDHFNPVMKGIVAILQAGVFWLNISFPWLGIVRRVVPFPTSNELTNFKLDSDVL
jgi:hypothetical protein